MRPEPREWLVGDSVTWWAGGKKSCLPIRDFFLGRDTGLVLIDKNQPLRRMGSE